MLKELIQEVGKKKHKFQTADVVAASHGEFSRPYVSSILSGLVKSGELLKKGAGKYTYYALHEFAKSLEKSFRRRYINSGLEEHIVFDQIKKQTATIINCPENVDSIINYAFSEMLNNAIDHSGSKSIEIEFKEEDGHITFTVLDHGVGVFRNVMNERRLNNEFEAAQDLLKGKTTTQPLAHSGEGIFFTSKVGDLFELESYGYKLRVDNRLPDVFIEQTDSSFRGTKVSFTIQKGTKKHLGDTFKHYQTDPEEMAFDKTEIQVRLYATGTVYVSRSQAKRILSGLNKFKLIILDFDRVPTVGQAFADEIFRVFSGRHPDVEIKPINMNEAVEFMIKRAVSTKR